MIITTSISGRGVDIQLGGKKVNENEKTKNELNDEKKELNL